ncbi:MAG: thioesterase family protein [Verrucomicrobiota bacterium]|jgi:acyl-CoA thioester hydrolase
MLQASVETRVRFAETDAMGVTYHGNYLPWFEMARVALLDQLGTPYRELEKQGCLLPVLETGLTYHRPSHFDDRIRITVTLAEKPKARLRLTYKVERGEELLVEGFTVHAFVNREFKAIRPPENIDAAMRKAFSA